MASIKLWIITICLIVLVACAWFFGDIVTLFVGAGLVAFLLSPITDFIQQKMRLEKRILPTIITFIGVIAVLGLLMMLLLPQLYNQIASVTVNINDYIDVIIEYVDELTLKAQELNLPPELAEMIGSLSEKLGNFVISVVLDLGKSILAASLKILDVVIFLCLTFYLLLDGRNIYRAFESLFPQTIRFRIRRIATELDEIVWKYVKASVLISFILFCVALIGFLCFGLEYALLLAIITFFFNFIPYFGSIAAGVIACLSALLTNGFGTAVGVLIFFLVIQQLEGNIISPKVQGNAINIHPIAIIFSLLACNRLFGFFGMFISVPVAGLVKVLCIEIRDLYRSIDSNGSISEASQLPIAGPGPKQRKKPLVFRLVAVMLAKLKRKHSVKVDQDTSPECKDE